MNVLGSYYIAIGEYRAGTVMLGREKVGQEELDRVYSGRRIPKDYSQNKLKMMSDLFSLPEACLLADVVQHFRDLNAEVFMTHTDIDIHIHPQCDNWC